ncbi:MAG: peptidylprolyl isomerase [Porphyromonadaceae bacterium]|nr:peptidylprolyl isomerase [Porphyromonadaceae bacterium]
MQKLFLILTAILLSFNLFSQRNNNVIDEVIWIVGDEAILKSDVEAIIQDAAMRRIPIEGDPYCVFPEQMAIEKLFLHQAAIDSISANESAVIEMADREIDNYVANVGSVAKAEEYQHKTISQMKEEMRERYKNQSVVQQMQQELVKNIEATPAEIRRYFGNVPADSLPTIPAQVELQVLSLRPPIPLTEINRVKEQLREFTERANKTPSDFSLLARLYSEDKGSAIQGGELGFAGRGDYYPEFAAVAFNMQDPNKVSRIVETEVGFHIIQFIERRGDRVNARHILLRPKASSEDKAKGISQLDSIADQIRSNKINFEQAVMRFSQDKNTRMNAGLMMRPDPYTRTITSKFEYQDLPPEIAKIAYDMKVGEVSDAFTMIDQATGNEVITIVKIKSKTPTHKANVKDDYQVLKSILEEKRKAEYLNEWIAKKQKETYISIAPDYRNCDFQHPGWIK